MHYSTEFLSKLDVQRNKTIYVKLISLNFNEEPVEFIEGRATSGSISIDGASAVRRTCQISMVADTANITDYYWTLKTKFKVQIGMENTVSNSPKIIWFDQGIFIISSFSAAYNTNSYTINISGKDKMCMLNGELGGTINSSAVFDSYDEIDKDGNKRTIKNPIKQIIKELVHHYGKEPIHNIIISDLDDKGLELLEYRLDKPLYLLRKSDTNEYIQATLDASLKDSRGQVIGDLAAYDTDSINGTQSSTIFYINDQPYCVGKIDYGETAGYREIELIYPTELTANVGESVTSVLDKIKNMLGDFEYFYNTDGQFIFQQKKAYINTAWSPTVENEGDRPYVEPYFAATPYAYEFSDTSMFTSINNTPKLNDLKNDFTVWGTNSKKLPIHMRYAIDTKPNYYRSIEVSGDEVQQHNAKYGLNVASQTSNTYWFDDGSDPPAVYEKVNDWREIIYQMQKDYYKYNFLDDFELKVAEANPEYYPTGVTGYEQYYVDIQGFWRYLYCPYEKEQIPGVEYYSTEPHIGWNKAVYENPSQIIFWFDFLDTKNSDLAQYSVSAIGIRAKAVKDDAVKAIYYGDTPPIIFGTLDSEERRAGYKYFNVPDYYSMFSRSTQGKSAVDAIDSLLYNHSYCIESISIQSIPIYYLEPNTLIRVKDGEYLINKISIPLAYNGKMSITGTKVVQRLY